MNNNDDDKQKVQLKTSIGFMSSAFGTNSLQNTTSKSSKSDKKRDKEDKKVKKHKSVEKIIIPTDQHTQNGQNVQTNRTSSINQPKHLHPPAIIPTIDVTAITEKNRHTLNDPIEVSSSSASSVTSHADHQARMQASLSMNMVTKPNSSPIKHFSAISSSSISSRNNTHLSPAKASPLKISPTPSNSQIKVGKTPPKNASPGGHKLSPNQQQGPASSSPLAQGQHFSTKYPSPAMRNKGMKVNELLRRKNPNLHETDKNDKNDRNGQNQAKLPKLSSPCNNSLNSPHSNSHTTNATVSRSKSFTSPQVVAFSPPNHSPQKHTLSDISSSDEVTDMIKSIHSSPRIGKSGQKTSSLDLPHVSLEDISSVLPPDNDLKKPGKSGKSSRINSKTESVKQETPTKNPSKTTSKTPSKPVSPAVKCGGFAFIKEAMEQAALERAKLLLKSEEDPKSTVLDDEDSQLVDDTPTIANFDDQMVALNDYESSILESWDEKTRDVKINGVPELKGKLLHKMRRKSRTKLKELNSGQNSDWEKMIAPSKTSPQAQPKTLNSELLDEEERLLSKKGGMQRFYNLKSVKTKTPHMYQNYLTYTQGYMLHDNPQSRLAIPWVSHPLNLSENFQILYDHQENERYQLRVEQAVERERLALHCEQHVARLEARAARAKHGQELPFSATSYRWG